MNNVSLVGRVTKDPQLRELSENTHVTSFTIAVNRSYKNQAGEAQADFIQCNVWGNLAKQIVKYCGKGSLIGVSGRLQSRNYMNNADKRIYITDVNADEVKFIQLKNPQQPTEKPADFQLPDILLAQRKE
ncbi:MAG: single-stranded DNA-binding protein [Kurthia sp.]|nr:single-stranded DNA-binding protein [Candidatus Kurthia equi]